jgi:hypothetical protein
MLHAQANGIQQLLNPWSKFSNTVLMIVVVIITIIWQPSVALQ